MADLRLPELNKVFLAGRLTRDPELRYLPSGTAVCEMGLASDRRYKTRDGENREETLFINVTAWARTAEYCGKNLRKGRPIMVEGELRSDSWEDKNTGQKRTKIEVNATRIQQLDWDDNRGGGGGGGSQPSHQASGPSDEPVPEDDIPF